MSPPPPPPPPPPAAALMEELIEEILLRLPPHDPALLVRAALVCKQWCRLVSGAFFRRRFRELHRTPPMLGFLYTSHDYSTSSEARFVRSAASCPPIAYRDYCRVLDARHGRVLRAWEETLVIWDPIADEQRELPFPKPEESLATWTAAVLCAAHGSCDHLDCQSRPSLVVFVCTDYDGQMTICTYSSNTEMWSDTIHTLQLQEASDYRQPFKHSALVGNALYFVFYWGESIIKYELESHETSEIDLPLIHRGCDVDVLVTTVDGGLGLATLHESKLYMWSRKDGLGEDAGWTQNRVIDLEMFLRSNAIFTLPERLLGIADEIGVIILKADKDNELLTFDLKTYKVKKNICEDIYEAWNIGSVFPYMSFYTPALGAACRGNGPGSSSA